MAPAGSIGAGTEAAPAGSPMPGIGAAPARSEVPATTTGAASTAAQSLEERFSILRSIAEECVEEDELLNLLQANPNPVCYDGFEPSGRMHIAQGAAMVAAISTATDPVGFDNINLIPLQESASADIFPIEDRVAMLNKKLGGDLDAIRTVGSYMVEVWKALGVNMDSVEFLWSSEEISKRPNEYLSLVMDIAMTRSVSVSRILRCCQIMGRSNPDSLTAAQFLYPLMQCADVFFLKVDICQLGMDQRKVNMLAREYAQLAGKSKPIILSHHMLPGLKEGQGKMSKSDPSSAIFMEDDEINSKIKKAFCPLNDIEGNPCLEYLKYIVLPWFGSFEVVRKEANGGNKIYRDMDEVLCDYGCGALHPADLKPALAKAINKILQVFSLGVMTSSISISQPVRDHFNSNSEAKALLETVKALSSVNEVGERPLISRVEDLNLQ